MSLQAKIYFHLDPNEWHGHDSESLWAERIRDDVFRIMNVPFYIRGVSFGDTVSVSRNDDKLRFESVRSRSGHSTYRIIFLGNARQEDDFGRYWKPLQDLGCSYESRNYEGENGPVRLLAVDVPSEVDIHRVYSLLEKGEVDKIWSFEEGHCGHNNERQITSR